MSKPWIHAQIDAKKFGGIPEDYLAIHEFMDSSKGAIPTQIHRAIFHTSFGISVIMPRIFGETFQRKSDGKTVSTRDVCESHCLVDFNGFIPTFQDFAQFVQIQPWMENGKGLPPSLSQQRNKTTKTILNYD